MTKTTRARRATALTAAAVAVAGAVAVTTTQPSAAHSAAGTVRASVDVSPVVTSISPLMGLPEGGTLVSILGAGFAKIDPEELGSVTFGGVPVTLIRVMSDSRLVVLSPPGSGNALVKVNTSAGASRNTTTLFGYRLKLGAEFDTVAAKASGGTEVPVTVTGGSVGSTSSQFAAKKITAKVGGVPTSKVAWVDDSHVKVTVPAVAKAVPSAIQLVQDGFTGPESTSKVDYAPAISSVTPGAVSVSGGDTIRITGAGFLGVDTKDPSAVTVGGVPATYFEVISATRIDATVPAAEHGFAAVKVTAPGGGSADGPRVAYGGELAFDGDQYLRAGGGVHLLAVTGGTLGANLAEYASAAVTVRMGSTKLTTTYVDPTHLKVTVPALTAESAGLALWQDVVAGPVTTLPVVPVVTSLSATSGPVSGGIRVTVKVAGPGVATSSNFMFGSNLAVCPVTGTGSALAFVCTLPAASEAGPVPVTFTSGNGTTSKFTPAAAFSFTDID